MARSMKKQIDHQYHTIKKQVQLEPINTDRLLESQRTFRDKVGENYSSLPMKH